MYLRAVVSFSIGWAGILVASSGYTSRASGGTFTGSCLDLCIVGEESLMLLFVAVAVFELVYTATLLLTVFVVCVGGKGE